MKIDHLVIHIDRKYQIDEHYIKAIRNAGLPYEPNWGKGTKGFKASNLWIGREYFEMVHLLKEHGGGWMTEWVEKYNQGHRGLICLMLDVDDIEAMHEKMSAKGIRLTPPQYLQFKWGFGLLTRTMPWRNSYVDFFGGVPLQIGFQQMKDEKAEAFMCQYMVPNAKENGIEGIQEILINGSFADADFMLLEAIFEQTEETAAGIVVKLDSGQTIAFNRGSDYQVFTKTQSSNTDFSGKETDIENVRISVL